MRPVLAIGAHPDDIEISCSGTLKLLRELGFAIHIATLTLGECGSRSLPADEISRTRRTEAEEACGLLGAAYHYAGSKDFCIFNDDVHNRRVTAIVRRVAPAIVITHPPCDYMLDHETTSTLARNACFYAPAPNYDTTAYGAAPATTAIPHLYYSDVMEGVDIFGTNIKPEFFVDISDVIDFKASMLACHRSQREWLRAQHGLDEYVDSMRLWCGRRGEQAANISGESVKFAESYRQHRGHAYPRENIIAKLLQGRVTINPEYFRNPCTTEHDSQ
jgi:LmbE family N-acetylglucosaminyl deacetylase